MEKKLCWENLSFPIIMEESIVYVEEEKIETRIPSLSDSDER